MNRTHRAATRRPAGWRGAWLALLAALLLAGCGRTTLYSQLDEQQANEMMAALLSAGVDADKRPSATQAGWEVRVGRGDFPRAMQVLASRRLPRPHYVSMCETFKKEGFASSAIEERARYQCSRESDLARTISGIPGVAEARVHIVLPERDPLGNVDNDTSAAVTIFEQPGASVRDRETDIKAMVKDSVEGLDDPNKVTVKFYTLSAPQVSRQGPDTGLSLAAFSPLAIGILAAALALLALAVALLGRLRGRAAREAAQAADGRLWKG